MCRFKDCPKKSRFFIDSDSGEWITLECQDKATNADYCEDHANYMVMALNGLESGTKTLLDKRNIVTPNSTIEARVAAYRKMTETSGPLQHSVFLWILTEGKTLDDPTAEA